jgi:outer membrane receptor protein involved in Fe transport
MKLTRTDVTSLMVIAVGGVVGLAAFGPHRLSHSFSSTIETSTIATSTIAMESSTQEARVRIRRSATAESTSGEAISDLEPLVYVDGVRVEEMPDLDPDGIERIEVIKGDAAIELYGEDASNGVVQIFLKAATAHPGR